MTSVEPRWRVEPLTLVMLLYGAASLTHFAHNAVYIDDYPNLPVWLTATKVWAAWFLEASIGLVGYVLIRRGYELIGLALVAVWAALGFDGLAHYTLAPMSAHTFAMNATIWAEVSAAALLSVVVAWRLALTVLQAAAAASTPRTGT
jgi:hypothetical protein